MADNSFFSDESLYPNSMITGEDMSTNMGNIGQTAFTINASKSGGDNVDTLVQFSDKASQGKHTLGAYRLADNTKLPLDFTVDNLSERTRNAIINNPTYASYYWENPAEWNSLDSLENSWLKYVAPIRVDGDASGETIPGYELTGWATEGEDKKKISQEISEQERFNAIAGVLNHKFPNWRKESDDDVRISLKAIENVFGVSTNGISIERLRETKGIEWERVLNLFGAVDIVKALDKMNREEVMPELKPENLAKVDENSPLYLQEAKLRQLQEEELSMRNSTWGEDVLNSVISSVPLMTEMWITGGLSNVSNLVKAGWSAAIKEGGKKGAMKYALNVMKEAAASGLRRIPAYIPQSAAEAYNYNYASRLVTFIDGEGNIAVEATDEKVSNFVEGMLSYIVQHYTEVTSEELGGLIPDFDAKFASWLMRRSVRNSVVSKLINNPVTRNIAEKSLRSVIPFDGIVGEFAEEEVGNLMQYFATSLMELANFDEQNTPGVQKPFLSLRDTGTTLASIALQGPLFRASTAGLRRAFHPAGTYGAIRNTYRARKQVENFQDSVKVFRETKVAKTGNINEAERALYMHTEGDALMNIDREDAKGILYQLTNLNDNTKDEADSNREALQDIGISDGTIKVAEERGSDIIVSRNRLLALASSPKFKNAMAIGEAVINEVASMEFGKRVKDITPDTFIEGKIDELIDKARDAQKLTDEVERRMLAAANTAYKNAEDQWKADPKNEGKAFPGISKSAINSFASVFSVFSRYLSNEVQDKQVVMDLVKGLSIEFIRDPESFDAKEAVRKLREASGMKTSDRVITAQKKVDEARAKIANLEERISDYEKYPGMSEQDEEKYQVLQDELYEEKENLADREKELEQAKKEEPSPLMQLIGKKGMANLADAARFSRKLALAKRMKKSGRTSDAIWLATGWHLGADKKWRMEIPYLKLKNKMPEKGSASVFDVIMSYFDGIEDGKLSDFVDAPELFQAYPKLKDIDVKFEVLNHNIKGGLTGDTLYINTLYYAPRALHDALSADTIDLAKVTRMANSLYDLQTEMRMTIVHEVQHAIQEIEGFAKGTTTDRAGLMPDEIDPKYVRLKGELDKAEKAWHKAMIAYRDHLKKNGITNEKFQNVPYDFPNAGSANRIISSLKESPYAVDKKTVKLLEKMVETNAEYQAAWDATKASRDVFDRYFRYAGEVESRNASLRSLLLDDDLMALSPDETEMELDDPVAREDQIVLFQIATEYQKEMLNEAVRQAYDSGETSRPQVAAAFKKINFKEGTTNLDLGGGKYDFATDYLASKGVTNLVYDPVNRNSETNSAIFNIVQSGGVDTVTCNNVLNVIKEAEIRSNVILQAAKALRAGGTAYFSVYVGDKSGVGRATQNNQSWQNNRPTKDYMDEIRQHFSDVTVKNDVIMARGPIVDNKTSAWFNDGFDAPPVYYQIYPVYTGSAASYDQPSMAYVGTGEGGSRYGYGLYTSSEEEVARRYATALTNRKIQELKYAMPKITVNGREYNFGEERLDMAAEREFPNDKKKQDAFRRVVSLIANHDDWEKEDIIKFLSLSDTEANRAAIEVSNLIDYKALTRTNIRRNLYRQTLWENKQENLLDWDKLVPKEQQELVAMRLQKEVLENEEVRRNAYELLFGDEDLVETITWHTINEAFDNYDFGYTMGSGHALYDMMTDIFGSKKAASEFLYRAGIDGITYRGDRNFSGKKEGVRNYVVFNDADIRVEEHIQFQKSEQQKGTVQGLMIAQFGEMQNSLITLFQGANASTLPHESAHWLKLAMEYLVESGYASDKMAEDLRTINEWLDKQDYSEKSAKEQGIRFFKDGSFDVGQMREEYFARAFEAYLTTGKFPERATNALKTALRNLTKLLQAIYRNAQSLNVKMDESITQFFDGLFTVDSVVEETGVLSAILREINEESLSMTKQQIDDLKKSIQKQQDVAEAEAWHAAVVAYQQGIREQIPIWRNNANISYEESRAEKAFVYVKGAGHKLYEGFLRDTLKLPEDTIANLRAKGLTVKNPYRADMTPANTTAETAAPPPEESSKTNETATEEELKNSSELDGSFEQFDALPDNAVITIPKGQAGDDILAVLSYDQVNDDETVTQSPIERRVHTQSDILRKEGSTEINSVIYNAAVKYFAKTGVHTKGGLLKFVSSAVSNANINKAKKNGRFILAPNTTEADENGNLRPGMENQATEDNLAVLDKEMVLNGIKAVVDELGQQKTEDGNNTVDYAIAQIVYELAASDSIPSVKDSEILKAIRAEYRERSKSRTQEEGYKAGHSLLDKASRRTWKLIKERVSGSLRQTAPSSAALGNSARTIADAVEKFGYASPIELINELLSAKGRRDFIRDYIAARKEEYREAFLNTPEWNSETGAVRVLDAILRSLNMIPPGEKFAERAKVALEDAKNDMMENMTVGEILSVLNDNTLQTSLRSNMSQILKAIKAKESDRMKLVQVVLNMQKSAVRLSAARELKARAEKAIKRMVRRGKLKAGVTIDEDALNAIKAINRHFGISNTIPRWGRGPNDPTTPYAVIENMIRREADLKYFKTDAERTAWINEELLNATSKFSEWIRKDGASGATSALLLSSNEDMGNKARQANGFLEPFRSLSLEHLEDIDAVVAYLYGKSRDLMENVKGTFASEREEKVEAITEGFNERGKNYNASEDKTFFEKIGGMIRSGIHQNKSLVFLSHFVDRFKEFYSDEIGPFRKNFELQISYGESVMMHLQMKYEGMCKPHLLALMNSCKDRKLSAPIKNETTRQFGYGFHSGVLDGKEMAFVLLNAGAKENRQRLLESFGWTEEELNGILQMFTEEDYKHAEAIWSALQEMGTKMSEVYFKERHTRMKWVENTKIELKNNEGKLIVSEGGYYPLAYKYRFSAVNDDFDIINQPGNPKGPSEPSSVKTRAQNLRNICIYMSPFVLTKAIRDNARYIGLWEPLRMANAIWTDKRFRESMVKNYGEETYNVLRKLMDRVNNPDRDAKYGPLLNSMGAIMSTVALGFKLTTTVKQLASMYVGIDRLAERANISTGNGKFFRDEEDDLYAEDGKRVSFAWKSRGGRVVYTATDAPETGGALFSDNTLTTQIANEDVTKYSNRGFGKGYFADAFIQFMQNPVKFRRDASEDSPFLRDRYNLMDRDLSIVDSEFKNPVLKVRDKYRKLAYWSMKQLDLCVAAVQWRAAYNYAINSDQFTEKEAMAYADDFVASSQGGARDIDIPAIQLDTFGRAITPFFGPACAAFNTKFGGLSVIGKMTPSRATSFFVYSFLFNAVACAYIQSLTKGNLFSDDDDDEDKARKAFWKALLSETVSGVPIIQDLADTVADMAIEGRPPRKSDILSVGMLRTANEIIGDFLTAIYNAFIGDYDYALYLGTSMASEAYGVPFVKVWEYYEKWWYNLFGDRYSETIKQKVKGE